MRACFPALRRDERIAAVQGAESDEEEMLKALRDEIQVCSVW